VNHKRLVVGVNGSKSSRAALRWAVANATDGDGDSIVAIAAWERSGNNATSKSKVKEMLAAEIEAIPADERSKVTITTEVSEGTPEEVLVEACEDADMLVLGRQGHGKAWTMMFGSTSAECIRKVECPVVIVNSTKALAPTK
jgi:nucleotide-binding universal stress UspA family protein